MEDRQIRFLNSRFFVGIVLAAAMLAGGCAKIRPAWDESRAKLKEVFSFSKVQDKEAATTEKVERGEYVCSQIEEHQLSIVKNEITPGEVPPDDEIKHTIQYSLCAPSEDFTMQGVLTRRVIFKGRELFKDSGIETFKVGSGSIEAEITIPKRAPSGAYTLETILEYEDNTIRRSAPFIVKPD